MRFLIRNLNLCIPCWLQFSHNKDISFIIIKSGFLEFNKLFSIVIRISILPIKKSELFFDDIILISYKALLIDFFSTAS